MTWIPSRTARCTGIAASWCPRHGACTCPRQADGAFDRLDDPSCPLHAPRSEHPLP